MKAAIENFAKMKGEKKVLVLGGMMELGAESLHEHEEVINLINKNQWEKVVLVGKDFTKVPDGYMHFNDVSQARDWFRQQQFEEARILIKGSRSMQMEKVLE
jgi:UDP-N-acetylmuramoyl-tripeptide--D-alanyl-D-alanine ligase